jgi:hypothetical protein
MTEQERIDRAHREVDELRGFYSHLTLYVGVMVLLFLVDAAMGGGWWVQWPALGWGVGVIANAVTVYGRRRWGTQWEERQVAATLAREASRETPRSAPGTMPHAAR